MYPTKKQAEELWKNSYSTGEYSKKKEYIFHTSGVGKIASQIAQYCNLDSNKSYVCGLLHDYGKFKDEKKHQTFHGLEGYYAMNNLGYNEVAKICLTHTFPDKNFKFSDYPAFNLECLKTSKNIIDKLEYDDYDRLIQLSDMFFEGLNFVNLDNRLKGISARYNLSLIIQKDLSNNAYKLLDYFNQRCDTPVYKIIGLE